VRLTKRSSDLNSKLVSLLIFGALFWRYFKVNCSVQLATVQYFATHHQHLNQHLTLRDELSLHFPLISILDKLVDDEAISPVGVGEVLELSTLRKSQPTRFPKTTL
jgi:hypothetical protein